MPYRPDLPPAFHAHVYFDAATRDDADALRERITHEFPDSKVGRFHEKNVGPHPMWSFQIAFSRDLFDEFVPWLMMNRNGHTVLLHPLIDDVVAAHDDHAVWMGEKLSLDLEWLKN